MLKKLILPLAILGMLTLACTLPSLGTRDTGSEPGGDPDLLFFDDFSDPDSGWDVYSDTDGNIDYVDGVYRIFVSTADMVFWGNPYQDFQNDVRIQVDATKAGGPDDNDLGVICRYQDVDNFYMFAISSDGYAAITMYENGEFFALSGETAITSDAIRQGEATNQIEVTCIGTTLTLFVNETQVLSISDDTFTGGDVGLYAGTFTEGGVDIHFDNFRVSKP